MIYGERTRPNAAPMRLLVLAMATAPRVNEFIEATRACPIKAECIWS